MKKMITSILMVMAMTLCFASAYEGEAALAPAVTAVVPELYEINEKDRFVSTDTEADSYVMGIPAESGTTLWDAKALAETIGAEGFSCGTKKSVLNYVDMARTIPADVPYVKLNGHTYEILHQGILEIEMEGEYNRDWLICEDTESWVNGRYVYLSSRIINNLFSNVYADDSTIKILDVGDGMNKCKTLSDHEEEMTVNAMWQLYNRANEHYEFVMKNVNSFYATTQNTATNACGGRPAAFVYWGSHNVNIVRSTFDLDRDELACLIVHEAEHCAHGNTERNENKTVPIQIQAMIDMGFDVEEIQGRIDGYADLYKYKTGAKNAQVVLDNYLAQSEK